MIRHGVKGVKNEKALKMKREASVTQCTPLAVEKNMWKKKETCANVNHEVEVVSKVSAPQQVAHLRLHSETHHLLVNHYRHHEHHLQQQQHHIHQHHLQQHHHLRLHRETHPLQYHPCFNQTLDTALNNVHHRNLVDLNLLYISIYLSGMQVQQLAHSLLDFR